jgi:hypothetical protein
MAGHQVNALATTLVFSESFLASTMNSYPDIPFSLHSTGIQIRYTRFSINHSRQKFLYKGDHSLSLVYKRHKVEESHQTPPPARTKGAKQGPQNHQSQSPVTVCSKASSSNPLLSGQTDSKPQPSQGQIQSNPIQSTHFN